MMMEWMVLFSEIISTLEGGVLGEVWWTWMGVGGC